MRRLRRECPWDRAQTHDSLRAYLLEETYEVLHALDAGRYDDLCEELGDLVLQVVFHAEIAEEAGRFTMEGVLSSINEKLVRRWETIKSVQESKPSSLAGVPDALPALVRAVRVLTKIRQTGVDPFRGVGRDDEARRWLDRLSEAVGKQDAVTAAQAAGVLSLFVAEMADRAGVNAEDALRRTLGRLGDAFREQESSLREQARSFADLSDEELNRIAAHVLAACEGD